MRDEFEEIRKQIIVYWGVDERALVVKVTVNKGEERFTLPVPVPISIQAGVSLMIIHYHG